MKDYKSRGRKTSPHEWPLRDLEAEEVDRRLGRQTRREWVRDVLNGPGARLTPEQKRDIDDEGYHAGWSMSVPSWGGPYRERTKESEIWRVGWRKGREDRERYDRDGGRNDGD